VVRERGGWRFFAFNVKRAAVHSLHDAQAGRITRLSQGSQAHENLSTTAAQHLRKGKMVFQVLERKYISYEKLIAKLAELFPNNNSVTVEVSAHATVWGPSWASGGASGRSEWQTENQGASRPYQGV
jgi:hypothetical protein